MTPAALAGSCGAQSSAPTTTSLPRGSSTVAARQASWRSASSARRSAMVPVPRSGKPSMTSRVGSPPVWESITWMRCMVLWWWWSRALSVSGYRLVFCRACGQGLAHHALHKRTFFAHQGQAGAAHVFGAHTHQRIDELEVLHELVGHIQVQHGRHPLVDRQRLGKFARFHQVVQRHGFAREGAAHAGQQAVASQGQAFVGQVVHAEEELVAVETVALYDLMK